MLFFFQQRCDSFPIIAFSTNINTIKHKQLFAEKDHVDFMRNDIDLCHVDYGKRKTKSEYIIKKS